MKKYLILIIIFILNSHLSQAQNNYSNLWEKVENFEKEGLTKSALKIVDEIKDLAIKEGDLNQKIKALIYSSKYSLILEEDAQLSIINNFKTQIEKSKFPEKNILESLLANLYWQYFNQNRWRFYNRTNTAEKVDETDFRTWDLQTIFNEIDIHYQNSLQSGLLLQLEDLKKYDTLLNTSYNSKNFRPTLFDFLTNEALTFYKTDENNITKPAYKFEIDNPQFIGEAKSFSRLKIESKDSTSLQLKALKIYQDIIKFHLDDKNPLALANADIERINYVYQNATFNDKNDLLLKTLNASKTKHPNHEASGLYDFELANFDYKAGNEYDSKTKKENQWKIKNALERCEKIIANFPDSFASSKAQSLKSYILDDELNITTESFLPVNKPSKLLVKHRNLDSLIFKVYKLSKSKVDAFNKLYRDDEKLAFVKKIKPTNEWSSTLKNENDYQLHSSEISIPKLENGYYLIFASTDNDSNNIHGYGVTQVTNVVLIEKSEINQQVYQFIDRNNGAPLSGASIHLSYDDYSKNRDRRVTKNFTTDTNGEIKIPTTNDIYHYNVNIIASYKNDRAYFGPFNIYNKDYQNNRSNSRIFLFTDRSIYRPGQTVYFKGIMVKREGAKSEIIPNSPITISLKDVNDQVVKSQNFVSNEYASIHGEFILPDTGLTGLYSLSGYYNNSISFSVEEYKRPKFETHFEPVTESYKINDSINIKGIAMAYSGSNITDAKVVYRVHRKVQYPRWCYWYWPYLASESQEISHGELTTNNKGEYNISFKALPDNSVDKSLLPIFNYEVTADVTDINGETHSTTSIVNVGYHSLTATMSIAQKLDANKKDHKLSLTTQNLNGEFVPAKGSINIYKLQAPNRVLRKRPWPAPDYQQLSENDFKKLYPHDSYNDEDDESKWEKGKLVFNTDFNTESNKEITLGNIKKWNSGKYVIELITKDKFGQEVKDIQHTEVYNYNDNKVPDNQLFFISADKNMYVPGDNVKLKVGSASEDISINIEVEKDQKIVSSHLIHLSNDCEIITIPVNKDDIGGFAIHYSLVNYNSFKSGVQYVSIPYPTTDLQIETLTFRDKLQPGQDETWSFNIKGPKGDKVAAEMLASMYDASLDQFKPHNWSFSPFYRPQYNAHNQINSNRSFGITAFHQYGSYYRSIYSFYQSYDGFNWFNLYFGDNYRYRSASRMMKSAQAPSPVMEMSVESELSEVVMVEDADSISGVIEGNKAKKESAPGGQSENDSDEQASADENFEGVQIRTNLQETSFFFPQLQTDAEGNVSFSFTTPEALTQWKLQLIAHTKTLESATKTLTTVTQKELMVVPNAPRFLREGDQITINSKISNLTEKQLSGQAILQLFDAVSGKDISKKLFNNSINSSQTGEDAEGRRDFTVDAKGNTNVSWTLKIPYDVQAVQYKVIAKAGDFSDGEQNALPVLSNRMLVTETMPMWIRSNQTKTFTLDKLKNNTSTTLKNHQLTLEMTSNPAWYAVQALPYLMEYPHECNEQMFSRYYANTLASHIANSNPKIQEVFNQWKNTDALLSNLEKNQELKSILIQETPWLRDAQSETEQKKRIALLFDLNRMTNELQSVKRKLGQSQMGNGAWPWFNGGRPSRFITQHIITGFGHLKQLKVEDDHNVDDMISKAIPYLDREFVKDYEWMKKHAANINDDHLSYMQLHYLYMRSFFKDIPLSKEVKEITLYYKKQAQTYWLKRSLYSKGLLSLILHRMDDKQTANKILKSLKENSITNEELGMYWKENVSSWYWYQAPIETQALMIEAFSEIEPNNIETIDNLKIWLLKNKQTNQWSTTKSTTEAIYALLLQGSDWLSVNEMVDVLVGNEKIDPSKLENVKVEAGTGYYKTSWNGNEVKPKMAEITLTKKGNGIAWGALYWQYFEDLDKITHAETPLKLSKKLFLKTNTDTGEKISEITDKTSLKVGDLVRVRIELKSDRAMEFVHMKDMRASGLEPINVLSQYKWQDGLGYYESTKDASTNFFFDYLPKGVYVFEYDLRVNNAGNFSNGITTIQSMYAPEFTSHSEGVRVNIEE